MSLFNRIQMTARAQGKNISQIEKACGFGNATIRKWEKQSPSVDKVLKVANYLKVSFSYLCTGQESNKEITLTDAERKILEQIQGLSEDDKLLFAGMIAFTRTYRRNNSNLISFPIKPSESRKLRPMRVFDMPSSAGTGLYLDSDDYTTMDFDSDIIPHGADFGVRIRGDSMIPFVNDDDIVFVKSQPEMEDGEIGIVVLNGSALCKKYCVRDGEVLLVSLNPKYDPIEIKEYDDLHFVGKVVGRVTPEENTKA